ncbi:MAG TPA: hypothetical protein VG125_14820 [Pirellulales bacterium]|jgi:hypothetical protein|nr:hypothetical protein [Pirellulales bacterium]
MSSTDPADPREPGSRPPAQVFGEIPAEGQLSRWLGLWSILAAVVAGVVAWLIGETNLVWVAPKGVAQLVLGHPFTAPTAQTKQIAELATAVRLHGVFGALLGLALGAVGGLARRSRRSALTGALLGVGLGAAAGSSATVAGLPLYYRFRDSFTSDLVPSLLMHCGIWATIGASAAVALAVGAGRGQSRLVRALLGGAMGALLGAVAFEILGAMFFANDQTGEPISTTAATRLLARLLVATFTAIGTSAAFGERRRMPAPGSAGPPREGC